MKGIQTKAQSHRLQSKKSMGPVKFCMGAVKFFRSSQIFYEFVDMVVLAMIVVLVMMATYCWVIDGVRLMRYCFQEAIFQSYSSSSSSSSSSPSLLIFPSPSPSPFAKSWP